MFTEEEKIRAIELYFKYGKKLAPVVRELGYPSKRNLRRWIRSWEAGGGAKESIRHKHRYSDEQKQVAVEHYLNHGCCLAFTSRALGYPCTDVLARWVNELYPDRRRIFTSKANPVAPFEPEVKRQAVMALCTRQVSASEVARRIGVSRAVLYKWKDEIIGNSALNRPGFPGECFICELRLPDHCFRWKHNKLFLLLPEEYGPAGDAANLLI